MIKVYVQYMENFSAVKYGLPTEMRIVEIVADKSLEDALKKDFAQIVGFGEVADNG